MRINNKWANTRFAPTVYKAFTLVELIVVITILAILGTIAFISLQGYSRDARDSTRTADIGNIKTSLELYTLKTGKHPKPDNFSTISYSGTKVWYQGEIGDQVTTNLKGLNQKPLDPLLNSAYTYSTTNNFKEYEVLALYEGVVAYNSIIPQANAATTNLTPKVIGNYNQIYVQAGNYVIPTPSILTSEGGDITLNGTTIKSQIVTNGSNIPQTTISQTSTGQLIMPFSVFTGSIQTNSTNREKIELMKSINNIYRQTTISGPISIQKTNKQLLTLANNTIIKKSKPTKFGDWRDIDPICDIPDIVVGTQTWAGCNSTIGNGTEFGKADDGTDGTVGGCVKNYDNISNISDCIIGSKEMDSNSKENKWVTGPTNLGDKATNNIWGKFYSGLTAVGACISGYHLPSDADFVKLEETLGCANAGTSGRNGWGWCDGLGWRYHSTTNSGTSIAEILKIPLSGIRSNISNNYSGRGMGGNLRTSTLAYVRQFHIIKSDVLRGWWSSEYRTSVRCIKD